MARTSTAESPTPRTRPPAGARGLRVSPFLHVGPDHIYNPVTDRAIRAGEAEHAALGRLLSGAVGPGELPPATRERLRAEGWLLPAEADGREAFRLKYVSLEAHTVCNQKCYFCPVAYAPREPFFMPMELYLRILDELAAYRDTLEAVFMINYNEPTVDRRFVEQVRAIRERGLAPATLSNGWGLTPERVDALCAMGGLRFLSINISTIDHAKYRRDRGADHVDRILANLDYMASRPVAEEMEMVVLGEGDAEHERSYEAIRDRFAGTRFRIASRRLMDRAGYLQIGDRASHSAKRLCGCENIGSRPLQHLHITPHGKCVLCCEDYDEHYVVGDLTRQSVTEVLTSEEFARLRRWAYGVEPSPASFICNNCVFARTRD